MGLTSQEVAAFEEYFYHIMAARGSGEHALRHLLAPFARAKHPLEGRLHELKVPISLEHYWHGSQSLQSLLGGPISAALQDFSLLLKRLFDDHCPRLRMHLARK